MSDQELLREYLEEGSERAFQSLVQRHVDLVYWTALGRIGDAGLAEEVTQNVFVALARKAPFLSRDVALADWTIRARRRSDDAVVEWRGLSVCELRDGKITWWREHHLAPPQETKAEPTEGEAEPRVDQ